MLQFCCPLPGIGLGSCQTTNHNRRAHLSPGLLQTLLLSRSCYVVLTLSSRNKKERRKKKGWTYTWALYLSLYMFFGWTVADVFTDPALLLVE